MGLLVNGKWKDKWYDTESNEGRFIREDSQFRHLITADGSSGFKAEADRYHLYVSLACPWAHRTLIFRRLKKLERCISLSIVHPHMEEHGWTFEKGFDCVGDSLNNVSYLYEIYLIAKNDYSGRVTVPVLWDKKESTIVNNESSEIIRMLNNEFDSFTDVKTDFYPSFLQHDIDQINELVYHNVNNGVYKSGFATRQEAYEEAFIQLFDTLDMLEERLSRQRYLVGDQLTEADWRLFTTLIRFDAVYYSHFKCNKHRIADYHSIFNYMLELYQHAEVSKTVNMTHIKEHYYHSHRNINPTGIVPVGPQLNFEQAHDRDMIVA